MDIYIYMDSNYIWIQIQKVNKKIFKTEKFKNT